MSSSRDLANSADVRLQVSSMVEANKAGILAEIKRLGEGIVIAVEVLEHE